MALSGSSDGPAFEEWELQILTHFDDLEPELRAFAWREQMGLRDEILRRRDTYRAETQQLIMLMVFETNWQE